MESSRNRIDFSDQTRASARGHLWQLAFRSVSVQAFPSFISADAIERYSFQIHLAATTF